MKCETFQRQIPDLLRDEAETAVRAECDLHRSTCFACQAEWEAMAETWEFLAATPTVWPSVDLAERFYHRLYLEHPGARTGSHPIRALLHTPWFLAAACVALLAVGFGAGSLFMESRTRAMRPGEFEALAHRETIALLHRTRSSDRLIGVALLSQGNRQDPFTADALLDLVERDPDPQVRLASLEALYLYSNESRVCERLAASLAHQSSPQVQAAVADLLLALREKRALEALRQLLRDPALRPELRRKIESGLDRSL